ncbi:MAG TPA: outer membrane protein transport protein [Vicinamibacteria bacterium]|nr:outer membrane protein transport protein [Vicinamibacteria bacterium]
MRRIAAVAFLVWACLAGFGPEAAAQQPTRTLGVPPVKYNFAPPGARSLAMGAAFIGLADDATASESNPAGLTVLTRPELSAHFRYSEFDNEAPNTVTGSGFETFTSRVGSPSFFSVVYPWQNAAVSVYYQRAADYRTASQFSGLIEAPFDFYDVDTVSVLFRTENIGLSGAFKLGDKVSIGASIRGTRVVVQADQGAVLVASLLDPFLLVGNFTTALDDSQSKTSFNAGILFSPTSKFSIGGVYKRGASFDFTQTAETLFETTVLPPDRTTTRQNVTLAVPDVFGGGLAIRPNDQFTIVADVVQVQYSDADPGPDAANFYQLFGEGGRQALEDKTEFHAGLEYTFARGNDWIFSVRGGYYFDPDHDGLAGLDSDQNHATFGGGVVVKNKLQVDVAANIASAIKEGLISFVVRF